MTLAFSCVNLVLQVCLDTVPSNCDLFSTWVVDVGAHRICGFGPPFLEPPSQPGSACSAFWDTAPVPAFLALRGSSRLLSPWSLSCTLSPSAAELPEDPLLLLFVFMCLCLTQTQSRLTFLYSSNSSRDILKDVLDPVIACHLTDGLSDQMNEYVFWGWVLVLFCLIFIGRSHKARTGWKRKWYWYYWKGSPRTSKSWPFDFCW